MLLQAVSREDVNERVLDGFVFRVMLWLFGPNTLVNLLINMFLVIMESAVLQKNYLVSQRDSYLNSLGLKLNLNAIGPIGLANKAEFEQCLRFFKRVGLCCQTVTLKLTLSKKTSLNNKMVRNCVVCITL